MATTVGLIKGVTEAILGIGEVGDNKQSKHKMISFDLLVPGLCGQFHIQAVLQVECVPLYSRECCRGLQSVLW